MSSGVDLLDRREVDLAGLLTGGRVVDGAGASGGAGDGGAADPVADAGDGGSSVFGLAARQGRAHEASSLGLLVSMTAG
jgi:hypothetical protein